MADEQSRTGKSGIVKILVAGLWTIIVGAIGVLVGYYINDYLSKDNIGIEQVDFIPETKNFLLSEEDNASLTKMIGIGKYSDTNMHLHNLLFRATYKIWIDEHTENFKLRQGINKKELDILIESIDDFVKWKTNVDNLRNEYIKRLEEYKDGDSIVDIMIYANDSDIRDACSQSTKNAVSLLLDRFKSLKRYYSSEDGNISRILNGMKSSKQDRTGLMKINVVFLNHGNTDGLVSRNGDLYINGEEKPIKIKMSNNNMIPKVERRSMLQTDFEIKIDESTPRSMEILKNSLTGSSRSQASIEVSDIRGKKIRSKDFPFPIHRDTN